MAESKKGDWEQMQEKTFTRWMNTYLKQRGLDIPEVGYVVMLPNCPRARTHTHAPLLSPLTLHLSPSPTGLAERLLPHLGHHERSAKVWSDAL